MTQGRILVWFSCGSASAVAAKLAVEQYGPRVEVLYCDTFKYEHPDNLRFFFDVQDWLGQRIKVLKSDRYEDIFDVYRKTRWLVGPGGARCTTELKKMVRVRYQRPDDVHVFGFTFEEHKRITRFKNEHPELKALFPLSEQLLTKEICHEIIAGAGIDQPAMYRLGYKNNNCVGCVKGGAGYWNKIRRDFPESFNRMAAVERELNVACIRASKAGVKHRVFLDELPTDAGHELAEPDIECGVLCINGMEEK